MSDVEATIEQGVRDFIVNRVGVISSFARVPCPHEHRSHYPVAYVTLADGRELVAKWSLKPEKVRREAAVLSFFEQHGIPAPVVLAVEPAIPVLVMERLYGQELTAEEALSPASLAEVGGLLARIHALPVANIDPVVPVVPGDSLAAFAEATIAKHVAIIHDHSGSIDEQAVQQCFIRLQQSSVWDGIKCLIRRDMHWANWFRCTDGRLAVIDNANAAIGYVAYDLAHLLSQLGDRPDLRSALRDGYGEVAFDAATRPETRALCDLVNGVEIVSWVYARGVPQPRFEAEGRALIESAIRVATREGRI